MIYTKLVKLIRQIAEDVVRPYADDWGDGIAATVEGSYVSVSKGAEIPTSGFWADPGLDVRPGDHVLYLDRGAFKTINRVLNRNATVVPETNTPSGIEWVNVRDYGAIGDGIADDWIALQDAINFIIPTGGVVYLPSGFYRITQPLDFSAMKGALKGVALRGGGSGYAFSGSGGTTIILNDHAGPAITAYGTLASGVAKAIAGLELSGFFIKNVQSIGSTAYTIDMDYVVAMFHLADIFIWGQNLGGNGIRIRNFAHGQGTLDRVVVRGFTAGTGFRLAVETTSNVDVAPNSGNIALVACQAIEILTGFHVAGVNNLINSGSMVACKATNVADITGSIGFRFQTSARDWTLTSPHSERNNTGFQFDNADYNVITSPMASYPAGTPDANSAGIRFTGTATGNTVWSALCLLFHYGVRFEDTARTNVVQGNDRTGLRVLTAWSDDQTTNKGNAVIRAEGESPWLWSLGRAQVAAMQFAQLSGTTVKAGWYGGNGTPEGAVTAEVGSLYSRWNGGAGTSLYVKESGTGNTGWVAK